jgi:predicted metalloendopeptidase
MKTLMAGFWFLIGIAGAAFGASPISGVDTQYVDDAVRPQDDIYRHLNGKWLDSFQIPADKAIYTTFAELSDLTDNQLRGLVEGLLATPQPPGSDGQKVADLYGSFMDETRLEALGIKPLQEELHRVDAVKSRAELAGLIARFNELGVNTVYDFGIDPDARDSTRYAVTMAQSGLGMPDRDYYLKDDPKLKETRAKYQVHVANMLRLAGAKNPDGEAAAIVALETALARVQWTKVENRDPIKTYNKTLLADLPKLLPGFDWKQYLDGAGLGGKIDYVIISQPSYFSALKSLIAGTPLPVWKSYFRWQLLAASAPFLSKAFVDERFAFTGKTLRGIPEDEPRWKRGIALTDRDIGEALGHLYVDKYFPPENKARMQALVANLIEAYRRDIDTLDWMGPETKRGAQAKLAKLVTKIGYPDVWRDYGALQISRDDLVGNLRRANRFEFHRQLAKLGRPIDRNEWIMTPQTINAYYNPLMNEIVFPAAILQPPFFNVAADDAVNYGGIGAVIGHEISHGFDDQGSQFDADGNLHDWFTKEDHQRFAAKTGALVAQYNQYEPVPGFHINGELTLGENIADNSGLAIAFKAYELSLGGKPSPTIDGLSGEQRLFYGWARVWRGKSREAEAIRRVTVDPHSPSAVRALAPVVNQGAFYEAFGVGPGDKMYVVPEKRVTIW